MKATISRFCPQAARLCLWGILLGTISLAKATVTVTTLNDSGLGSLRQAISDAAPGDTIDFAVTGTITLTSGELVINKALSISGPGAANLTVSGNNASRVFRVAIGNVAISSLTVANGFTTGNGGGVWCETVNVLITNCTLMSNSAHIGGGTQSGTLKNCSLTDNRADYSGGADSSTLDQCVLTGNYAFWNGGGVSYGILNGCTLSNNSAWYGGGASASTLNNCTLIGNGFKYGGGAYSCMLTNCLLTGNYASLGGGDHGSVIVNCTLSGNSADTYGGGTYGSSLNNCTVFGNTAAVAGCGIVAVGTISLRSSIVAGNPGTPDAPDVVTLHGGVINSLDFNLIGNTNGAIITGVTTHNIYGQDPKLGPLADNGGPTPTHALLPGSPAIDHGSSGGLATDQRGQPRPCNFATYPDTEDGSDIGAYELQGRSVTTLNDSGPGSLRQAIADAAPSDTIDFAVTGTITLTSGQLVIDKDLTITGPGKANLFVSGNNSNRVFNINSSSAVVVLSGLTITNGNCGLDVGGGILNVGNLIVSNCIVSHCIGVMAGAGIYSGNASTLRVESSSISGNASWSDGGSGTGIACPWYNIKLTIINSTISSNYNPSGGGGIMLGNGGVGAITNCTFSGNSAGGYGGAIDLQYASSLSLDSCTISGNTAGQYGGGGILNYAGATLINIRNSAIAGNTTTGGGPDCAGPIVSLDYNFIGNTNGASITGVTTHNIYGQDPLLGPLADNGGPTPTHALLPGSPAIDHGSSGGLATDQRGQPRSFNFPDYYYDADDASDIGAVEMQEAPQPGPVLTVNSTNDVDDGVAGIAHCSLREAIAAANANPDTNTIVFATAIPGVMTGVIGTITLTNGQLTITNSLNIVGPGAANLTVSGNNASRVIYNYLSRLFISGLTIADGLVSTSSESGGGILNAGGSAFVSDCVVSSCVAARGGGICSLEVSPHGGSVQVSRSTITKNAGSYWAGGGLFSIGWTRISDTAICSNSGGGVYDMFMGGITNSTISGNTGIGLVHDQTMVGTGYQLPVIGCTICSNSGVGIYIHPVNLSAVVNAANTIVAGNSGGAGPDCSGHLTSMDYNLIQNTNGVAISGFTAHNIYNQDPKLGPLADLGGPTPTHALRFDSPALDAGHGSGLTTDQRGLPRPIDDPNTPNAAGGDGSDIGAYEADPNLRIMAIEKVGADIRLRFNTVFGRTYGVQSKDNLDNSWGTLTNNIPGTGSSIQALDTGAANQPHRFYRGMMLLP